MGKTLSDLFNPSPAPTMWAGNLKRLRGNKAEKSRTFCVAFESKITNRKYFTISYINDNDTVFAGNQHTHIRNCGCFIPRFTK